MKNITRKKVNLRWCVLNYLLSGLQCLFLFCLFLELCQLQPLVNIKYQMTWGAQTEWAYSEFQVNPGNSTREFPLTWSVWSSQSQAQDKTGGHLVWGIPALLAGTGGALAAIDRTWALLPLSKHGKSCPYHKEAASKQARSFSQLMALGLWPLFRILLGILLDAGSPRHPQGARRSRAHGVEVPPKPDPRRSRSAEQEQGHDGVGWTPQPGPAGFAMALAWWTTSNQSPSGMSICGGRLKFHSLPLPQQSTSLHMMQSSEVAFDVGTWVLGKT